MEFTDNKIGILCWLGMLLSGSALVYRNPKYFFTIASLVFVTLVLLVFVLVFCKDDEQSEPRIVEGG